MTNPTAETPEMRSITIEIPVVVAQKMAETFEGTLEDATLQGLRLLHGMGIPAYTTLQAIAKQREISVPKAMRAAIEALSEAVTKGKANAIGRPKINDARDVAIYNQVAAGHTYAEVSNAFGISLVRVGQIVAQQRAMRGINPREALLKRNEQILSRLAAGESRLDVAASFKVSRSVVDYLAAQATATQPRPTRVLPETFKVKTPEAQAESEQPAEPKEPTEAPDTPAKPRYVMPSLEALKAQQADQPPADTRTAIERNVFDPEFGF
jgi:DNA-binding CsgD family transcriptional regulator